MRNKKAKELRRHVFGMLRKRNINVATKEKDSSGTIRLTGADQYYKILKKVL